MEVKVEDGNLEQALKRLRRKLDKEGMFVAIRRQMEYRKPSERKRRQRLKALRKQRREAQS